MKPLGSLVLLALALALAVAAQQPAATPPPAIATPAPESEPGRYLGAASCAASGCHGSTQPLSSTRVLQNEYYTWLDKDRHARAYNVLFNDKSARIAKSMRIRGKAYEAALCLDCHTTNVPAKAHGGTIDLTDGVQCEACHGPASGWRAEHIQAGWTHEQSVARGMTDLRKVPTRASLCGSCHVGTQKKEVDHELIASGHPFLAFELDNYSETMPPHWTPGRDNHGLRAWAVGQAVAFRDSLDNLSRHARGEKWPEFADMSCHNCHHDLRDSNWRQVRGWPDRAGLPAWSPQRWAVLRSIVARVAPSSREQLDSLVPQLATKVARMNDSSGIANAADSARRAIDAAIPRIDAASWGESDVRAMMRSIAGDDDFILRSDVHSAEQVALSLQSLNSALARRDRRQLRSSTTRAIDELFTELQNRDDYEPNRFVAKLRAVRGTL